MATSGSHAPGPVSRAYGHLVVRLRFVLVAAWAATVVLLVNLPAAPAGDSRLEGFVPSGSRAIRTEIASFREFGFPLISRTLLVQRDPDGMSPFAQARVPVRAAALAQGAYDDVGPLLGGLPVVNTFGLFPGSAERGTTAVTYLFARPNSGLGARTSAARRLADRELGPRDAYVGVTGTVPARVEQARILQERLSVLELSTLLVIVLIVASYFRSVTAPAVPLVAAGLAFFVAVEVSGRVGSALNVQVPRELEPLMLALVLGIVTDYAIFFMSGTRRRLQAGEGRLDAVRSAAASTGPIVAVAGLTVAVGTGVLVVAESAFFSAFGPAMALAVAASAVVSLTLVPALLAILGRAAFWPGHPRRRSSTTAGASRGLATRLTSRPIAILVLVACCMALGAAASFLPDIRLSVSFVPSLPETVETRTAAGEAAAGFAAGVLSPTVLLVEGDGVADRRAALERLGDSVAARPGVAGVVGPGDLPIQLERRAVVAPSGDAARFLVVLSSEPLGATAMRDLDAVARALPRLGAGAGLTGVRYGLGGDTALASELVERTRADLGRITAAALAANLLLLALFLRALLTPVLLLGASVLGLCAALGALTYVSQEVIGNDGVTFYVPFAAAVLLLSLGSDYNIFGVGYVWERAVHMPFREALASAIPETSSAIGVAGVTLAASFAMLAVVPLQPFRELAFVMATGILLDALVVRALVVPALLTLLGGLSTWPRRPRAGPDAHPSRSPSPQP